MCSITAAKLRLPWFHNKSGLGDVIIEVGQPQVV